MDLKIIILLIVSLLNIILGILVYWQGRKNASNILWSLLLLSVASWAGTRALLEFVQEGPGIILSTYLLYFTASFIPIIFLFFSLIFPQEKFALSKYNLFLIPPLVLINIIIFLPNVLIRDVIIAPEGYKIIIFGPVYSFYSLYIIGYFVAAFIILFKKYFKSAGILKLQLRYILIGSLVSSALGVFNNLILPWFGYFKFFWLGPVFTTFLIIMVTYAITRHHFLNIKVISAEIFTALLILTFLTETILSQNLNELLFRLFILILLSIFGYILIKGVLREVQLREEYQNLNQLKSEFISIASHQLKTPLSIIKDYISLIQDGFYNPISEKASEIINKIHSNNERIINLVDELLDLSRIEAGKMQFNFQPLSLSNLIQDVIEDFSLVLKEKKLKLKFTPENNLPSINADAEKLKEVISNLIDNSIKYSEEGEISISLKKENNDIIFVIQDQGIGMKESELVSLFEKFKRGRKETSSTEGLGLGLYISKLIVEAHGGKIWAESEGINKGSSFFVKLPLRI